MRTALEYGQVPPVLVPALVRALLGALHIRCASGNGDGRVLQTPSFLHEHTSVRPW